MGRKSMKTRWIAAIAMAGVVTAGALGAGALAKAPTSAGGAGVNPADFTAPVANPYYPLVPGTVSEYRGTEDKDRLHEYLTVTHKTKVIQGVTTTVVHDVLFRNGVLGEKTTDWYAADNYGNVWYFGEDTAVYAPNGHVISTEGTWQAGVDGAMAGTIMPAGPGPTDAYRQEFYRGHAEDQAWIVQNTAKVTVPYGSLDHLVRSFEWTRLEPGVVALKFYAPGLGIVLEHDVAGGSELLQLVHVRHV